MILEKNVKNWKKKFKFLQKKFNNLDSKHNNLVLQHNKLYLTFKKLFKKKDLNDYKMLADKINILLEELSNNLQLSKTY